MQKQKARRSSQTRTSHVGRGARATTGHGPARSLAQAGRRLQPFEFEFGVRAHGSPTRRHTDDRKARKAQFSHDNSCPVYNPGPYSDTAY